MSDDEDDFYEEPSEEELAGQKRKRPWIGLVIFLIIVAILAFLTWRYFHIVDQFINGRYTPTPYPTLLSTPTHTATVTPMPTFPPTPTSTPMPPSAFKVTDMSSILPRIPGLAVDAVILDDETNVTAEPPFDTLGWITSNNLGVAVGEAEIDPFHATFNAGKVTWAMDLPLNPGIYEVFVLDTVLASAGPMNYEVANNGIPMTPLLGNPSIILKSSRGEDSQRINLWRSLGIYEINNLDNLVTVSTAWENRDENTIVSIDQVLIARYPDSTKSMIQNLPPGEQRLIVDDSQAENDARDQIYMSQTEPSWGDSYTTLLNPDHDTKVTWKATERLPVGKYQIYAWIPLVVNSGEVTYAAQIHDNPFGTDVVINQSKTPGNQWVLLGEWETPRTYEGLVNLSVTLFIPGKTQGEIAIDAIAFVKVP